VKQNLTFALAVLGLEHRPVDVLNRIRPNLDSTTFRHPWGFSFPQDYPATIGRQDFHCLSQGNGGKLTLVG
jgi:hypothetical protein